MLPVAAHDPLLGSYSWATVPTPATNTLPSSNRVAVWEEYGASITSPVAVQDPLLGSYSSADVAAWPPVPPVSNTLPSRSSVAL